jgi:hypothetical protein
METKYKILQTIYSIVKEDPDPQTYPCTYREIILKSSRDSSDILGHLDQLHAEGLLIQKKLERTVICITKAGLDKIKELAMSLGTKYSL